MISAVLWNMDLRYLEESGNPLTEKGKSVVPILQSICQWSDIFYKEDAENEMVQCQKCDHRR